jgi:hypothetical protein
VVVAVALILVRPVLVEPVAAVMVAALLKQERLTLVAVVALALLPGLVALA